MMSKRIEPKAMTFVPSRALVFDTVSSNLARFKHELKFYMQTQVLFDLNQVRQCDSAGIAFLVEVKRLCETKRCVLHLEGASEKILDLAAFCDVALLLFEEKVDGCEP
jgi:phospholipid transport system transporter-binding protein